VEMRVTELGMGRFVGKNFRAHHASHDECPKRRLGDRAEATRAHFVTAERPASSTDSPQTAEHPGVTVFQANSP